MATINTAMFVTAIAAPTPAESEISISYISYFVPNII